MGGHPDIGVMHWHDGKKTWSLGFAGFFVRLRALGSALVLNAVLAGTPFWWPDKMPSVLSLDFTTIFWAICISFLGLITFTFFYVRKRAHRSLDMKSELHQLSHNSRDAVCHLYSRTSDFDGPMTRKDRDNERFHLVSYSNVACEIIRGYFQTILGSNDIGCAIRLAFVDPKDDKNGIQFATFGRSRSLSNGRDATSEPVPADEGIPKVFSKEHACRGVLYIHDLEKATAHGVYKRTKNDELYPDDIRSMIVAPINGWNGKELGLIGLLYITSRSRNIMRPTHVDLVKFAADHLASVYTCIFNRLYSVGFAEQLPRRTDRDPICKED